MRRSKSNDVEVRAVPRVDASSAFEFHVKMVYIITFNFKSNEF